MTCTESIIPFVSSTLHLLLPDTWIPFISYVDLPICGRYQAAKQMETCAELLEWQN